MSHPCGGRVRTSRRDFFSIFSSRAARAFYYSTINHHPSHYFSWATSASERPGGSARIFRFARLVDLVSAPVPGRVERVSTPKITSL